MTTKTEQQAMSPEDRRILALEAEMADLAASRRALAGLARLGRSWALSEVDQLDRRLSEAQSEITTIKIAGRK